MTGTSLSTHAAPTIEKSKKSLLAALGNINKMSMPNPSPASITSAVEYEPRPGASAGAERSLDPEFTFQSFVQGSTNEMASLACLNASRDPGNVSNPVFIYGSTGLGKTHLLHAVGNEIKHNHPDWHVRYVTSEDLISDLTRAVRFNKQHELRTKYRQVDVLLVDDIQFIEGKDGTQLEFFHIFNTLYDQGKQIVICSDKPPKDLELTEGRLISRFEWGLISYIEAPDLEHRIAILQKRAQMEGVNVDPQVLQFLAEKIRSNIRSLEGSLTRLLAMASLDGRKINLELAAETVRHYSTAEAEPVKLDVETIIQVVAEHFKMKEADILGKKRNKEIVAPRQIAMYLAREMGSMSYPDIGRAFARDYTTVIHSYEKIKAEIKKDSVLKNLVSEIRSKAHARG